MLEVFLFEAIRSVWVLENFLNDDEEKFERMAAAGGDERIGVIRKTTYQLHPI
jgi:hypothetical protein